MLETDHFERNHLSLRFSPGPLTCRLDHGGHGQKRVGVCRRPGLIDNFIKPRPINLVNEDSMWWSCASGKIDSCLSACPDLY